MGLAPNNRQASNSRMPSQSMAASHDSEPGHRRALLGHSSRAFKKKAPAGEEQRALLTGEGA